MADLRLRRAALTLLLRLPAPVLRLLAGSEPGELGGRVLDPQYRLLASLARRRAPPRGSGVEGVRRNAAEGFALGAGRPEPDVRWEALEVPGPAGPRPARLYRPAAQDPQSPALLWMHQGGGVVGDLETSHAFCTVLARAARAPVLSLDYRLAPEHRRPAALEDALAAYRWARGEAGRWGAPPERLAVGGDSFGGHLAAVVCQELRRAGEPQPALQLLVYPSVDFGSATQAMTVYAECWPLTRGLLKWFRAQYLTPGDDLADPALSPLRAPDLAGLAPAVVVTAGFDPLVDQGEAYAHRLVEAAVPTLYRCYDRLAHGFLSFTGLVRAADVAAREIGGLVRQGHEGLLPVSAHALAAHPEVQAAADASATERKPSARSRWLKSRFKRPTRPGPA